MISTSRRFGFLAAAVCLCALFVWAFFAFLQSSNDRKALPLDSGWTVEFQGASASPKELSRFEIPKEKVSRGDWLILERELPQNLPSYSFLHIRVYSVGLRVLVNGRELYRYGFEDLVGGKFVGGGVHSVELPAGWEGGRLRLELSAAESEAFTGMPLVEIFPGDFQGPARAWVRPSPTFFLSIFLVLFGAISVVVGVGGMGFSKIFFRLPLIGFFSLLLGIWTLCYTKEIQILSSDLNFNTVLEYAMLFQAPIAVELLFISIRRGKIFGWRWCGLCALPAFNAVFFLVVVALHALKIVPMTHFLWLFHIYAGVGLVFLILPGVLFSKRDGLSEKISSFGFVFFCLSCLADLILYNASRLSAGAYSHSNPVIPWGVLVFLVSLLVSYAIYLQQAIQDQAERDILSSMAYRDALTGLYNRAKCEQIFRALEHSASDYAIVSIDLNGLKRVNDTFGHSNGDLFLQAFARALSEAFSGIGTAVRMGGDEFVVIVRSEHLSDMTAAFKKLEALQEKESENLPQPLSASIGMANWSEVRENAEAVYRQADSRMYKMKASTRQFRK